MDDLLCVKVDLREFTVSDETEPAGRRDVEERVVEEPHEVAHTAHPRLFGAFRVLLQVAVAEASVEQVISALQGTERLEQRFIKDIKSGAGAVLDVKRVDTAPEQNRVTVFFKSVLRNIEPGQFTLGLGKCSVQRGLVIADHCLRGL